MLIGNMNLLAFDLEPVHPSWERRSPVDKGPWAKLAIWVKGRNLTAHTRQGCDRVSYGVYVPLAPIADWFVRNVQAIAYEESSRIFPTDADLQVARTQWRNALPPDGLNEDAWDDERFSWTSRHFLLAGAEGAWLPDLAFVRSDDTLWLSWNRPSFASADAPRFLDVEGQAAVPWVTAVETLGQFVDNVAHALRQDGLGTCFSWAGRDESLAAKLEIDWERFIDLALPVGPDRLVAMFSKGDMAEVLTELEMPVGASPLQSVALQCLRDLKGDNGLGPALLCCERATRGQGPAEYPAARQIAQDAARAGETPEKQGQEAARAVRDHLNLGSDPLPDVGPDLGTRLGISLNEGHQGTVDDLGLFGARSGGGRAVVFLLASERTSVPWAKRMEFARGVGHLLLDAGVSPGIIGAGSSSRATGPRRRRSGAFAAELLLPRQAMMIASAGKLDTAAEGSVFKPLLSMYKVGARTAAWQLYNAGLLSSRDIVEELIARFGADPPG